MKKIYLILLIILFVGCKKVNEEVIKYRLSENEKIVVELKEDSNLKYNINGYFYITYNEDLIGSVSFINKEECTKFNDNSELEIVKKEDKSLIFKDDNYHYVDSNNDICVMVNAKELDNLNKILDNIDIRIEKEK